MTAPCDNCPFLREGGVRVHPDFARQLAMSRSHPHGGGFRCHKTNKLEPVAPGWDGGDPPDTGHPDAGNYPWEYECAGGLIFGEKQGGIPQMARIAERLGLYKRDQLQGHERVFDTVAEMVRANQEAWRDARCS